MPYCYRYASRCTGNIQKHTTQQTSDDVQCHVVQGDTSCLQKIHARCNYTIFLFTSIYDCSYFVGSVFISRTKLSPHYKYRWRFRRLGSLNGASKKWIWKCLISLFDIFHNRRIWSAQHNVLLFSFFLCFSLSLSE